MQPLNRPVERADSERQLGAEPKADRLLERLVCDADWKPSFAFRVGYPPQGVSPSPRRSAEQVLISGTLIKCHPGLDQTRGGYELPYADFEGEPNHFKALANAGVSPLSEPAPPVTSGPSVWIHA